MRRVIAIVSLLLLLALLFVLRGGSNDTTATPRPARVIAGETTRTLPVPDTSQREPAPDAGRARPRVTPVAANPESQPDPETAPVEYCPILVHVVDERGEPISGAVVVRGPQTFQTSLVSGPPIFDFPRTSDSAGDVRFPPPPANDSPGSTGPTAFWSTHHNLTGFAPYEFDAEDPEQTIRLVLRPGVFLRGRVELPDGGPARDAIVQVWISPSTTLVTKGHARGESDNAGTDAMGGFEFGPYPPGPWPEPMVLEAVLGGDRCGATAFDERAVLLRLVETLYVRGRVVDADGRPSSALRSVLHLRREGERATIAKSVVGDDGSFALPCRPGQRGQPGRFDLELVPPWVEVHPHAPLLAGAAFGVTPDDEVILAAERAPHAFVLVRVAPSVDASLKYGGTMSASPRNGTSSERQNTTLWGGGAGLFITRPTGLPRLTLDFRAAGRWEGAIHVPHTGVIEHEVVLVPPR